MGQFSQELLATTEAIETELPRQKIEINQINGQTRVYLTSSDPVTMSSVHRRQREMSHKTSNAIVISGDGKQDVKDRRYRQDSSVCASLVADTFPLHVLTVTLVNGECISAGFTGIVEESTIIESPTATARYTPRSVNGVFITSAIDTDRRSAYNWSTTKQRFEKKIPNHPGKETGGKKLGKRAFGRRCRRQTIGSRPSLLSPFFDSP